MILRKPYAILIKYFQKIHLLLIFLSAYLFYKTTAVYSFVKDFIVTQSYNEYLEPISNYTGFMSFFIIFVEIAIIIILMVLLKYKKKPWKLYLFPLLSYLFLFVSFIYVNHYFVNFDEYSTLTSIMAGRDLLLLATIPQYFIFIIFGIRFLGIDLKKFGFKEDAEYLEIQEEDREEFEVNLEFDKDKVIRNIKKFWRNTKYVYVEHRFILNILLLVVLAGVSGYTYYYFGVIHKTYKEGNFINSNQYQIKVNKSYLTERDTRGDLIEENSSYAYMIVNVSVTNKGRKRTMNIDRFRLMNKNVEAKNTLKYEAYFIDLGKNYDQKSMDKGQTKTFLLVFKVKKELNPTSYVLYYQDLNETLSIKKIKLNVNDMREITTKSTKVLGEQMIFPNEKKMILTDTKVVDHTTYSAYKCDQAGCFIRDIPLTNPTGKILEISLISDDFEGESFIDFLLRYARINYKDREDHLKSVPAYNAVSGDYTGNVVYLKIPSDIDSSKSMELVLTFRNERYIYHLN